jgi:hypothetical protein
MVMGIAAEGDGDRRCFLAHFVDHAAVEAAVAFVGNEVPEAAAQNGRRIANAAVLLGEARPSLVDLGDAVIPVDAIDH